MRGVGSEESDLCVRRYPRWGLTKNKGNIVRLDRARTIAPRSHSGLQLESIAFTYREPET